MCVCGFSHFHDVVNSVLSFNLRFHKLMGNIKQLHPFLSVVERSKLMYLDLTVEKRYRRKLKDGKQTLEGHAEAIMRFTVT